MGIPYIVNQWWASICSAKQPRAALPREAPRAWLPGLGRAVQRDLTRLDARGRSRGSALGRAAARLGLRHAGLDGRPRRHRRGVEARTGRPLLRAREGRRSEADRPLVGGHRPRLGDRRRHGAARPDERRARAPRRVPRAADREAARRGAARADPRARERAAGVEPPHPRPARGHGPGASRHRRQHPGGHAPPVASRDQVGPRCGPRVPRGGREPRRRGRRRLRRRADPADVDRPAASGSTSASTSATRSGTAPSSSGRCNSRSPPTGMPGTAGRRCGSSRRGSPPSRTSSACRAGPTRGT